MPGISARFAQLSDDQRDRLDASLAASAGEVVADPVAVVGMSCRFPGGADSPAALWRLLTEGRDAIQEGPFDRWDVAGFYHPAPAPPGRSISRWGGFLPDIAGFDAEFFGISPQEAATLDPQHRLLLELCWEALEDAGIPPRSLVDTRCGVFAGLSQFDYLMRLAGRYQSIDAYLSTGNAHATAPGRVSYFLGVHGPSLAVDTACSSSLVTVHLASQSLRLRESDLALAGGVNLILRPEIGITFSRWNILSPTGRCRPFDDRADGVVRSDGAGMVVLKRLVDALRDRDRILAVVRGSAVNSDGRSNGLIAPSPPAQRAVLREAIRQAGVDPGEVGLVETHGTGTPLGDPIEFAALNTVYGNGTGRCALGAIKSNLGHTEAAAGIAGFIKAVLCLRHGTIPPNLHFQRWNPQIAGTRSRLFVPTEPTPWPVPGPGRLAAVSSFGFSGTNAHLVLEQAPEPARPATPQSTGPWTFPLSAGSPAALADTAGRLAGWLRAAGGGVPAADVAHTLAVRRSHHPIRLAVVADTLDELADRLAGYAAGRAGPRTASGSTLAGAGAGAVWVFSGQGSQWPGMGRALLTTEPAFAAAIDELDPLIRRVAGFSVRDVLRATRMPTGSDLVQPTLFAVQVALAATWRAYGIRPAAVIGHSLGEVAAAVVSGALSVPDGVRVICHRSRLLARTGTGAMASVDLPAPQVQAELSEAEASSVAVAVTASPRSTVVTGDRAEVADLVAGWQARGRLARLVAVAVAAHSPQVDPVLPELIRSLAALTPGRPDIPFYSTVTGGRPAGVLDAEYWAANLRRPVRLGDAVAAAAADGYRVFLEVSPHPIVLPAVTETLAELRPADCFLAVPTLRRDQDTRDTFQLRLGELYRAGMPIDWTRRHGRGELVDLPTTAWHHRRYWIDAPTPTPGRSDRAEPDAAGPEPAGPVRPERRRVAPLLHHIGWEPAPLSPTGPPDDPGRWLVLGEGDELSGAVTAALRDAGARCGRRDLPVDAAGPAVADAVGAGLAAGTGDDPVRGVVVLNTGPGEVAEPAGGPGVPGLAAVRHRVLRLVRVIRTVLDRSDPGRPPRLWLVTRGGRAVRADDPVDPGQAALAGLGRVAVQEYDELRPVLVDLDPAGRPASAGWLAAELLAGRDEDEVAWRDGERSVARLVNAPPPEPDGPAGTPVVRAGGGYLISGGLGGIGLVVARWLACRGAGRIVLGGRSAPSERAERIIDELRAAGTQVVVVRGDIAEPGVAERMVAAATATGTVLRGVVHAAGVADHGVLVRLDGEQLDRCWRGKVAGGWRLHRATAAHRPDWFTLFSSGAAMYGGLGLAGYAAANSWLDAFAVWRRARGLPALSVNWGPWRDVGMATRLEERGYATLDPDDAVDALAVLLERGCTRAGVFHADPAAWFRAIPSAARSSLFAALAGGDVAEPAGPPAAGDPDRDGTDGADPTDGTVRAELAALRVGRRTDATRSYLAEQIRIVLGLTEAVLEPRTALAGLGFDSLTAVQLRTRLERDLAVPVPATAVWTQPTLAALADRLLELMELADPRPAAEPGPGP